MKKSLNTFKNISEADIWNSENIYHLKTDISRIAKTLYQYETYKMISDVPGDFIELGVFKGVSLIRFLTFRSILENNFSRKFYGFDMFKKFPKTKNNYDKKFIKKFEKIAGYGISKEELEKIFEEKKFQNIDLIRGDIKKTIPKFLKQKPNLKISFLHLDLDTYDITKFVLNKMYNKVSKRGIILIDDYSSEYGVTKAVDEFLNKNKSNKLKKLTFYRKPSFIIKN